MSEFYSQIKILHIACVVCSGMLFTARGALMWAGSHRANHVILKRLSYAIDTLLLGSAVALASLLRQYPFVSPWLTAKILLLVVYVLLGSFALRRGRTLPRRRGCFVAALSVYLFIISVAITHDPRGLLVFFFRQ
jgi:uncharacterized membrane protein SirB2